jgi:cobalt-zinc-cadmium efflux system outer membrane protein
MMVTLPLEALYQRAPRVRQASAVVQAAKADADATRQQVLRDAARAFYRVARAEARLDAVQGLKEWMDTLSAYNRSRVQEGVTAEADLIRTELERDRATIEIATQQAELARAQAELAYFSGGSRSGARLTVALPDRPLNIDMRSFPSELAFARPELRAANARIEAASAAVTSERRMLFRELGATIGTKQMMGTTSMIAGFSLPIPLFNQNRGEVSRATAERDAARRDLTASTGLVESEYVGAAEAVRILTEQAARLASGPDGDFLVRAQRSERIALGAYREGAVSLLQVLDASRARSEARMAYYDLLFAQHEAVVDLLFASGQDIRASLIRLNPDLR